MTLIGLSGYARSGKDTLAAALKQEGYQRLAFADKLREVLYALNPYVAPTAENYFSSQKAPRKLQEVIDDVGWDGYKETQHGPEIRRLLQRLGTEAGRDALWPNIWVDATMVEVDNHPFGMYVVTDCRFPNEAQAIRERNGVMVRITRPGVEAANSHASETSLDDFSFDGHITNDGAPEDMVKQLKEIL